MRSEVGPRSTATGRLFASAAGLGVLLATALGACTEAGGDDDPAGTATTASQDGGALVDGARAPADGVTPATEADADAGSATADAALADASRDAGVDAGDDAGVSPPADAGTPAVLFIGRFADDAAGPRTAWPGARILARFDGTSASVTLTHTPGSESAANGRTWINVVVDGAVQTPREVSGASQVFDLTPGGLPAGEHTVEIEKRTEANLGTLRFEGFTFGGGAGLLPPPPRLARRVEFVSESTIDGFGVEGGGPDDGATCNGGAPAVYNNARKSLAFHTASALDAEHHLIAFSGKGVVRNNDGTTASTMPTLWSKTLPEPENAASPWPFASWTPDVVVVSLGGADHVTGGNDSPAGFQAAYANLVADIRARYGATPYVFLTVWSQLKDYNGVRAVVRGAIDGVVAARPAGERTYRYQFPEAPEAVETGCYYHANDAHHRAMAALLATEIRAKTGW